jgi:hypothetical protein
MDPENRTSVMLLRRGLALEYITLTWNVIGVIVLAITALAAGSVALAAFGIDSLIEILALDDGHLATESRMARGHGPGHVRPGARQVRYRTTA